MFEIVLLYSNPMPLCNSPRIYYLGKDESIGRVEILDQFTRNQHLLIFQSQFSKIVYVFYHNTDVVIGVVIELFLVLLGMIIDHILEFSVLIVESSQILVNSLMMDQPIHQIIRILWQFIHFQYNSHHFLYRKGKVSLIQVSLYVLNKIIHYFVRCICLTLLLLVKTLVKRAWCRIDIALEMLLGLLLRSYFGNIAATAASRRWVHIFE